ncbi:MAG TPA: pilus assembly protein TadG-related protein [Caulobacteraceae bacterium]|nr:pilus assembly protein TadG-related protein [Caulobacteraceae bacterium]
MLAPLRRFLRDEDGGTMVFVGALLPVLFGAGALGIDYAQAVSVRAELQAGADAAAMAGVSRLPDADQAETWALNYAGTNLPAAKHGDAVVADEIETGTWDADTLAFSAGGALPNAVRVTARRSVARGNPVRTIFAGAIGIAPLDVSVRSVARMDQSAEACILALSTTASRGVNFSGSSSLTLLGCNVMSNSSASNAVEQKGSSRVSVPCLIAAGGVSTAGGATLTSCSRPITNSARASDPFKDLPLPTGLPTRNDNGQNLLPGLYKNGLNLKDTKTLAAGTYVVQGGTLRMNANANVSGTGVTFVLTDGATVHYNGSATINLSAPTTGTYKGVLFYAVQGNAAGATFNGGSGTSMTGALYFPSGAVNYSGNVAGSNGCIQIVADTIEWTGSSTFSGDCSAFGMDDIPTPGTFVLVQ